MFSITTTDLASNARPTPRDISHITGGFSMSSGGDRPVESLSLNFQCIPKSIAGDWNGDGIDTIGFMPRR